MTDIPGAQRGAVLILGCLFVGSVLVELVRGDGWLPFMPVRGVLGMLFLWAGITGRGPRWLAR